MSCLRRYGVNVSLIVAIPRSTDWLGVLGLVLRHLGHFLDRFVAVLRQHIVQRRLLLARRRRAVMRAGVLVRRPFHLFVLLRSWPDRAFLRRVGWPERCVL